ncbi:TetR/AcrR family transcriptional regulator [Nocardia sp. CC201C]|uniref:TetR/AcrR family transcriptional regulator n=1 Tax=Nocardia sp. CC201C TaxID=3044575 RepID=UPI0024A89096|nr:TetR/AcrR family transcriptional regulator [Nocardia sp. CC201C]
MPRVSEEHLERRRQQILEAAQTCFARKGLHTATMQDVFAEAGLSAGAVYRYFKSKDDIVAALIYQASSGLRESLTAAVHRDPLPTPPELVRLMAETITQQAEPGGPVRLLPQAWSLALTNPHIADFVRTNIGSIRGLWMEYARRMRDVGWLPETADIEAVAKTLMGILPGYILQHLIIGDTTPEDIARGTELLFPQYRADEIAPA